MAVASFVIANMIGTGVFTSLGFQLFDIHNIWVVLSLWLLGGVLAFCGALIYAELGSVMPRSGGEYNFLTRIFHPSIGFAAGWVSITIGFAAPVAATCMALGKYMQGAYDGVSPEAVAIIALVGMTLIHSFSITLGGKWQTVITILKVALIILFIAVGFLAVDNPQHFDSSFDWSALVSSPYAISLIWVMFAYSGWNAATYIIGDIENPKKILAPALLISTFTVTIMYVLINAVFLYSTPVSELVGQVEVGNIAAISIFGENGGRIMSGVIALLLISSISSMVYVGPRVTQTMGEDVFLLKGLARKNKRLVPINALWLQFTLSLILILTASFEQIINFSGFTLTLCTVLVAIGLFVNRVKEPNIKRPFKTWGYPVTPIIFLGVNIWILVYMGIEKPIESLYGIIVITSGLVFYFINQKVKK